MLKRSYFAAANGYSGFRSYFNDIFISEKFKRIFILKGGPGTGKSTLMKRVVYFADCEGMDYEKIHCSSDPYSLDGVIINTNGKRYAIIDGTAPHERDAVIPGAIDTIVNLGDSFNISSLESKRDEIIHLNKKKKKAYKDAYDYLRVAGEIKSAINELVIKNFDYKRAWHIASTIKTFTTTENRNPQIALKRAFCKDGYYSLKDFTTTETIFRISGKYGEEMEFLRLFLNKIEQKCDYISFDPLGVHSPDAIISNDISFICTQELNAEFNATECLRPTLNRNELNNLKEAHDTILASAQKYFEIATLTHAELEDIYHSATDFANNDIISSRIINCIL